jgi:hypothetical protein
MQAGIGPTRNSTVGWGGYMQALPGRMGAGGKQRFVWVGQEGSRVALTGAAMSGVVVQVWLGKGGRVTAWFCATSPGAAMQLWIDAE